MPDKETMKKTVSSNKEFFEQLEEEFTSANSISQALLTSAEFGLIFRQAVDNDLETYIRETVRDELLECGFDLDDLGDE